MKKVLSFLAMLLVCLLIYSACDDTESSSDKGYSFTLTAERIADVSDGDIVYAKFVTSTCTDCDCPALYSGEAAMSGGSATITLKGIASGDYIGCAFIDLDNSSVSETDPMPEDGDLTAASEDPITIPTETGVTIEETDWELYHP